MYRIGIGQDSHPFSKIIKPLILGGVKITETGGLEGNSDGDAILHSLCNALSSAIGGDSIGTWSDEMCLKQGITDSSKYLEVVYEKIKKNDYKINNISIAVEAQRPRLSPDQIKMIKSSLAKLLLINIKQIGITFTSGEGLSAFGKGEGIQVFSITMLQKND